MAKRGPKPALTAKLKKRLLNDLIIGMSLADSLCALGLTHQMYRTACRADPEFNRGVKGAADRGKRHHLRRIREGAKGWQASAWFLERKYGAEYGQRIKLDHGGAVRVVEEIVSGEAQGHDRNGTAARGAGSLPPL